MSVNYVTQFTPTLTNEMYATVTSFLESFDARDIAALQKGAIDYPYNGAFANQRHAVSAAEHVHDLWRACRWVCGRTTRRTRWS